MNTLRLYFIEQFRNGESGYYAPHRRGTLDVWHDNRRYIYDQPGRDKKRIKSQILVAFSNDGRTTVRISGRWPSYHIDTEV